MSILYKDQNGNINTVAGLGIISEKEGNIITHENDGLYAHGTIYSTEEVKTNDIWIDGKPIYRRAVYINNKAMPAQSATTFISGTEMQAFNVEHVIKSWTVYYSGSVSGYNLETMGGTSGWRCNEQGCSVYQGFSGGSTQYWTGFIIFEYTKQAI